VEGCYENLHEHFISPENFLTIQVTINVSGNILLYAVQDLCLCCVRTSQACAARSYWPLVRLNFVFVGFLTKLSLLRHIQGVKKGLQALRGYSTHLSEQ
jgi:hypothetical protein